MLNVITYILLLAIGRLLTFVGYKAPITTLRHFHILRPNVHGNWDEKKKYYSMHNTNAKRVQSRAKRMREIPFIWALANGTGRRTRYFAISFGGHNVATSIFTLFFGFRLRR